VRLVLLASGNGTTMQAILDDPRLRSQVVAAGTDVAGCTAMSRAAAAGLPTFTVALRDHPDRDSWNEALSDRIAEHEPDLVVLAGFMKLVGPELLDRFAGRVVNTHPALCPSFPGTSGPADALEYGVKVTGATLFVVDEGVDTGPIIAQTVVPVEDDDDVESLHERIKVAERQLLVDTVGRIARDGFSINDRKVRIG
jgi:phosphoribosylglycinamide formyltransferase 1